MLLLLLLVMAASERSAVGLDIDVGMDITIPSGCTPLDPLWPVEGDEPIESLSVRWVCMPSAFLRINSTVSSRISAFSNFGFRRRESLVVLSNSARSSSSLLLIRSRLCFSMTGFKILLVFLSSLAVPMIPN